MPTVHKKNQIAKSNLKAKLLNIKHVHSMIGSELPTFQGNLGRVQRQPEYWKVITSKIGVILHMASLEASSLTLAESK